MSRPWFGRCPADVLTDEELVALDAALAEHDEPWPEAVPEEWARDHKHLWSLVRWRETDAKALVFFGQFVAAFDADGRAHLRRAPMSQFTYDALRTALREAHQSGSEKTSSSA